MVGRVSDGASERKLVITKVPLLPCLCRPQQHLQPGPSILTASSSPRESVVAPYRPIGPPGSGSCPHSSTLVPRFSPAHDLCSGVSVLHPLQDLPSTCVFIFVRLAPLRRTSGRAPPAPSRSMPFLLQE